MLFSSALLLFLSALTGMGLIAWAQWAPPRGRVWLPGVAHGLVGALGAALLLLGLQGPARGVRSGAGSFGTIAAVAIGGALAVGLFVAVARWRGRKPAALVLGAHALLGVTGLTMLAAYVSAP